MTDFYQPISFHLVKHEPIPGRTHPDSYRLAMNFREDSCPIVLQGVHVPAAALQHFQEGAVKGAHIETLVDNSVAKKVLGYPNYFVMGVLLKDGMRVSVTPPKLHAAFGRRIFAEAALTVVGIVLVGAGQTASGIAALLAGTHVFRTGVGVPHTQFWGHLAE